jgi:exosortase A
MAEANAISAMGAGPLAARRALFPVVVFCLGLIGLFWDTVATMVGIWESSATYKHGFIIVPISLWLVWDRREYFASLPVQSSFAPLLLTLGAGPAWLLADLIDVNVVQQFAFVALLVIGIWCLVGHRLAAALSFPLGFLFFAVPAGDFLVPHMMEFTASSTVALVKWTGIPVYREGMYFTLPSGSWSVVYACSGMRYLIAAVTLGVLYAYLTYRSLRRRLIFCAVSLVVPILANTARAYIIVMLGHLSGMKIATGVDHLLYGWVFFGIIMFILFWIGAIWREDLEDTPGDAESVAGQAALGGSRLATPWPVLVASLLAMAVWPALSLSMQSLEPRAVVAELQAPQPVGDWVATQDPQWSWRPVHQGPDREVAAFYRSGDATVGLFVAQYLEQDKEGELVSGLELTPEDATWRQLSRGTHSLALQGQPVSVERRTFDLGGEQLIAFSWYRVGGHYTANTYVAKLWELVERLTFSDLGSEKFTVVANVPADRGGDGVIQGFVDDYLAATEAALASGLRE